MARFKKEDKVIELFSKVANDLHRSFLFDKERKTKLLNPPERFENDTDWLRITDPEEFKRLWDSIHWNTAKILDEVACYSHKSNPKYNMGRFVEYKEELLNQIGDYDITKELYNHNLRLEELGYYELELFVTKVFGLDIQLDDEEATFKIGKLNKLPHGTEWDKYNKKELVTILKDNKLPFSGTLAQLKLRLKQNISLFNKK